VTSQDEKAAMVRAILALARAIIGVRTMVMNMKSQNDDDFYKSFAQSSTELNTLTEQIDLLVKALLKDG
jgi:hypothetical protein